MFLYVIGSTIQTYTCGFIYILFKLVKGRKKTYAYILGFFGNYIIIFTCTFRSLFCFVLFCFSWDSNFRLMALAFCWKTSLLFPIRWFAGNKFSHLKKSLNVFISIHFWKTVFLEVQFLVYRFFFFWHFEYITPLTYDLHCF